jgi:heme/copper-type cytochrome/quinol oxidase subunit 3
VGSVWPPVGIQPIGPWELPFLNTIILVTSGLTLTLVHRGMM